ncbi:Flagellar motor rotation protein MotA [hydrothermal vent metagenome]|uniref:Flagellar motor rotation protein MotA n=1 Tax=hydrothermal vent metagenome TaxID=652676 RepID=A0A3B1CQL8_9ZZZZ
MDIATLGGIVAGIGLVLISILMNSGLALFWSAPSAMIVIGGTMAAIFIAFPMNEVLKVMGLFIRVFMVKKSDHYQLIESMVDVCNVARKGGVLAIESKLKDIDNEFLKKGLEMTVDGKDEATVNSLLKREIKQIQKSHKDGWEIFNQMGAFAPAFGMVGTLIGLIQMLADLSDVDSVGPKMAIALITTFYGAVLSNLFFIPMTVKLKRRSATEGLEMNLVLEGISYIRKGVNPRFMKDVLENYLDSYHGKKAGKDDDKAGKKPAKK